MKLSQIWKDIVRGDMVPVSRALAAGENETSSSGARPENAQHEGGSAPADVVGQAAAGRPENAAANSGLAEDPRQFTLSEIRLLQALSKRRKTLDSRERELAQRQALLKAAEQQLVDRRSELLKIRPELEGLLRLADKKNKRKSIA